MTNASEVLSSIQSAFPGAVLDSRVESDRRLWATIDSMKILDVCKHLTTKLNFDHYSGSAGVDWIARKEMEVVEIMASHGAHQVVAMLKVKTPRENPSVKSLTGLYWNANWYEREIWEMFGINFEGHPELYPLLLSDELMGAWPWRKDYKGYPDLTTGERAVKISTPEGYTEYHIPPTPAEVEAGTVVTVRPKYPTLREREEKEIKSDSEMIMHLGPQHAMVPGPFLLDVLVEGERVHKAFLDLGYIHKGIEKIMENRSWLQGITYTDRMCYVASLSNNECYCGAIEKILGLEVPLRAQYIRVILEELSRIQSHLIGTGEFLTLIAGVGYAPWQYMIIDRENIISLIESVTGARLTHTFVRFGGVRNDLPAGFADQCKKVLPYMKSRTEEFIELFAQDPIYHKRMDGVGIIRPDDAKRMGVSGPPLRAAGVAYDMRKEDPILVYPELDFKVVTGTKGDSADRIDVRLREMLESIHIIEQCLDRIPEGPIKTEVKVPKKVPAGEAYYRVEDPRGEMGMYVISDGGDKPYRVKVRGPFYATFQTLTPLLEGTYIADAVAIAGSMDGCPSEADRQEGEDLDIIGSISQFAAQEPAIFALIIGVIGAAVIAAVVNVGAMLVIWGERKVLSDFCNRFGPNRVGGRWGILQLGADAIKLFTKEDIIPADADKGVYVWAPIVASMGTMLVAAAIPFGALHIGGKDYPLVVANMDISAFYVEAALSIMAIAVFMAGYSSNNKYSMLGAFRGVARMIAYEVPMGVCVISVAVMAHSLNLVEIVQSQTVWYAFAQPLGFVIFVIALITDLGRIPFDQSEAEEEIISGYNTEYSGIRWGLLYFQEYNNALLGSILLSLLFLGGWQGPIIPIPVLDIISPLIWLLMKVIIVLWFFIWVRSSLFRLRIDQVTDLGWKWMLPLSLVNLGWAVLVGSYFA